MSEVGAASKMRRTIVTTALAAGLFVVGSIALTQHRAPDVSVTHTPVNLSLHVEDGAEWQISPAIRAQGEMVGAIWDTSRDVSIEVRALTAEGWSEWVPLASDDEDGPDTGTAEAANTIRGTEPTTFKGADAVQFRTFGDAPQGLQAAFVDIGSTTGWLGGESAAAGATIQPRSAWDPDNVCVPRREPEEVQLGVAIVHHTGGVSDGYTQSDVPGILLGYCRYHRDTRGWDDIAYNFIIDQYGTIWEGRAGGIERAIRGAHAKGFSSYSTGIALIGNFVSARPSPSQERALTDLLAWKLSIHNVDPLSTTAVISQGSYKWDEGTRVTLNNIAGHRDTQATTCPGNACYNRFGLYRDTVASQFRAAPLDTYYPTITGDFTGDGVEDGAAFDAAAGVWMVTNGSSGDTVAWSGGTSYDLSDAAAADLNGDGYADVVAAAGGRVVEFASTGSGFSVTEVAVGGTPVDVLRAYTPTGEQTVVVSTDGSVKLGPSFASIGSVANPVDASTGDLDGDSFDEVIVVDTQGRLHVLSNGAISPLDGAQIDPGSSDRIVTGDFHGDGTDSIAAIDMSTGRVQHVVASGSSLSIAETVELDTPDSITEVFAATDGGRTRLLALDAYVGEWKAVTFSGSDSYVNLLEDQPYRTTVTRDADAAGSFLSWYGQEFGWLRSSFGYGQDEDTNAVTRVAGTSRYATNVAMTRMAYDHADHVVLATSAKFPDALAAGAVAAKLDGALLMTDPTFLPSSIAAEIQRLGAHTVTIAGGTAAISLEVEDAVRQLGVDVRRIGGANRYGTASMLSAATFGPDTDVVYIATGTNHPDALAGVPAAAGRGAPILLVADGVPGSVASELKRLEPSRIYILGGPVAVSDAVFAEIEAISGTTPIRLGGSNRYGTALLVSRDAFGSDVDTVFLAPGTDFLDALIAGPVAHRYGGPVLLTAGDLPDSVYGEIARLTPDRIVVVGSVIPDDVISDLDGIGPSVATEVIGYLPRP